jgi:catalase
MSPEQQLVLFENTARAMEGVPDEIKERHVVNCMQADPEYGLGVAAALGINEKKNC